MQLFTLWPKRYRLLVVTTSFLCGLITGTGGNLPYIPLLGLIAFFFIAVALLTPKYIVQLIVLCIATTLLGYTYGSYSYVMLRLSNPQDYSGSAKVVSVKYRDDGQKRVVLELVDAPYRHNRVRAYVYEWPYSVGTYVYIKGSIIPSRFTSDYGSRVIGTIRSPRITFQHAPGMMDTFRQYLQRQVSRSLPEPYASLAVGLLTGVNDNFDTTLQEELQRTGTTHIVAVSGYNLTVVALALKRLLQKYNRYLAFGAAVLSIVVYVTLAGPNPSILRGAVMGCLSLWATTESRVMRPLSLVLLGAMLLALLQPLGLLYSLSWQLSFLAFCGILFVQPILKQLITTEHILVGSFVETISAEVMVLPLIVFRFHLISLIAPFVNVSVLWLVPLAMCVSLIHAVVACLFIPLAHLFAWISFPLIWLIITPISVTSQFPFAVYEVRNISWLAFAMSYVIIGIVFVVLSVYVTKRGKREIP